MRIHRRESGSILVITLLVLGALTVLGLSTIALSGLDGEIAINQRAGDQAFYVAEAGVAYGVSQVNTTPGLITGAGTTLATTQIDLAGTAKAFPGSQPTDMSVFVGPAPGPNGQAVKCGLPGYSDKFGTLQFQVLSTGKGPAGASRQVQAIMSLPPREGLCPPGDNVKMY